MNMPHWTTIAFAAAASLSVCVPLAHRLSSLVFDVGPDRPFALPITASHRASQSTLLERQGLPEQRLVTPRGDTHGAPQLVIDRLVGITPELAGVVFAPAVDPLERCAAAGSGKASFRMSSREDHTEISLIDAGPLDVAGRRCFLESLSLYDDDALSQAQPRKQLVVAAYRAQRPRDMPQVEATVTVEW